MNRLGTLLGTLLAVTVGTWFLADEPNSSTRDPRGEPPAQREDGFASSLPASAHPKSLARAERVAALRRLTLRVHNLDSGEAIETFEAAILNENGHQVEEFAPEGGSVTWPSELGGLRSSLLVSAPGFRPHARPFEAIRRDASEIDVGLVPVGLIEGRARFADGSPVVEARVFADTEDAASWVNPVNSLCADSRETDPEGRFVLAPTKFRGASTAQIAIVGGGAYFERSGFDLSRAAAEGLDIVCAHARGVDLQMTWPAEVDAYPYPGESIPFGSSSGIDIDVESRPFIEVPSVFESLYFGSKGGSSQALLGQRAVFAIPVSTSTSDQTPELRISVSVNLQGIRSAEETYEFDLRPEDPFLIDLELSERGAAPGRLLLTFPRESDVLLPTGLLKDFWLALVEIQSGRRIETCIALDAAGVARIVGLEPGIYSLEWKSFLFGGPWIPIDGALTVEIASGAVAEVNVGGSEVAWWTLEGLASSEEVVRMRISVAASDRVSAPEQLRGILNHFQLREGRCLSIPLQPSRAYRMRFEGAPFFDAGTGVVPFADGRSQEPPFSSGFLVGGEVASLVLDRLE